MANLDLGRELDRLYALPLAEFITARNELAKTLRAGGDRETADRVKKLTKPSVTAWAVNALYHHERRQFDELLAAADAVRAALAGKGDRRAAEAARRKALRTLLERAAAILGEAGRAATPASRQRISQTLEALAARDPAVEEPRPGRLETDVEPQGFDVLTGLAASMAAATGAGKGPAGKGPQRLSTAAPADSRNQRLDDARRKLADEEAELSRLERLVEEAEAAAVETKARHERLAEEAAEADRLATTARETAAAAKKELAAAKAAAAKAKATRRRGLARVAAARRRVERQED